MEKTTKKAIKISLIALLSITILFIGFNLLLLYTPFWVLMPREIQEEVVQFKLSKNLKESSTLDNPTASLLFLSNKSEREEMINLMFDKNKPLEKRYLALKTLGVWAKYSSFEEREELEEFFEEIISDLENPESLRLEALYNLKSLGKTKNTNILKETAMQNNTSPELRWTAIINLAENQNPPQELFLERLKNDPDDTVRFKAAQAIWETASLEIIPALLDIASDKNNRPSSRDYAISAIRNLAVKRDIKNEEEIDDLVPLLKDEEYRVRVSASEALLALTGKDWAIEPGDEESLFRE